MPTSVVKIHSADLYKVLLSRHSKESHEYAEINRKDAVIRTWGERVGLKLTARSVGAVVTVASAPGSTALPHWGGRLFLDLSRVPRESRYPHLPSVYPSMGYLG